MVTFFGVNMMIQKSFKNDNKSLYIIPTPIGNLEDITFRAVRILKSEIDVLLCEDTRTTGILLKKYDINVKMISYHEHNKDTFENKLVNLFQNNDSVGLVSDAGMPGISDPGFEIISFCQVNEINVITLPGASAFLLGVINSNFPNSEFTYSGFLRGSNNEKLEKIKEIVNRNNVTIIYESTHKILKTLKLIEQVSRDIELCIGRELTKINEEYIKGTPTELINFYENNISKGEFIIVFNVIKISDNLSIEEEYNNYLNLGISKKEAIKKIAKNRKLKKNDVYMMFVGENE